MRLRASWRSFLFLAALTAFAVPASGQATDTDNDTMPDAWEAFFGLNPNDAADATGDPDGDGLTNAQEYAAGRHPVGRFARYFAEGSTGYFETSLAVLNLSTTDTAHVSIALLNEAGGVTPHQITLGPRGRQSLSLNTVLGTSAAVSIIVESDVAIAADRAMTWGPSGVGLSLDSGAPAPATTWYFAEGATGPFLLYYLFENPGATPATVTTRYLREGDTPISRTRTLPPHSRTTVFVNADDPGVASASLGAVVTADVPILAERAMYLQAGGTFAGGSASSGSPAAATQWYFGEGATGPFFHAFLSLLNPGSTPATATVTYHLSDGSTASKAYTVPTEGRRTIYFNDEAGTDPSLAALAFGPVWFTVSSTQPIVGERAMWWSTWPWYEGHAAAGSTISDVAWGVAEGRHGGPDNDQTYVLVGNTTSTAGQVRVSLIPDAGAPQTRDLAIAAGARLTIDVGGLFGLTGASRFSVTVESIGASPVPLAVDYARYRSVNGVPFSGGGAAPAVPLQPADAAPSVIATTPADGATGASSTANLVVTFNEPVNAAAGAFTLACPTGTPIALTVVTASPAAQFTLDPNVPLPASTTCTLTVLASAITDVDSTDPPDVMTADAVVGFTTAAESAPAVSTTTPANGAVQVGLGATLAVTFTEPVDVTGNWFQIVCATSGTRGVGDTAVTGGPTTFTIDPTVDFTAGEACTVTIVAAQITDQDPVDPPDAMAADHVFAFTADVAPTVLGTTPANGAVSVGTAAALTVTFSEPVTPGATWFQIVCATSGTRTVADTVVTGGPSTFTIDPNADFAPGELCTVTIAAAQVADQDAGDPPDTLAADYVFAFTTDVAPTVTATTPANGATDATTTGNLTVTFSEPVTVAGNWFQIVCGSSGTRNVADTVVTGGPTVYTIDPNADLAAGETCTVTIAAASIADQDAGDPPDALAADYVFSFTVDAQPAVTVTSPTNGATATIDTDITVTFSEPVNVTGNWFQIVCGTSGTRTVADTVVTGGPSVFTINPNADFTGGETCTVTIVAAQVGDQDAADPPDTLAANHVFAFTTDSGPTFAGTTPAIGSTAGSTADLTVTFSEPVDVTGNWFQMVCTVSGTRNVADFVVTGGPTTYTANPNADFTPGESCTVTFFAALIADQDAIDPPDTLPGNVVGTFSIDALPTVTGTTPANGAVQVATTANLSVTFSEPVDVAGSWFSISCSVSGAHTATVSGGPTTFTLNPDTDFASADLCTVTVVAAQVTDQDAIDPPDTMVANFVFSFTVDTAPGVTTTTPTNGATGVATSATVTVNFSESVNATTSSFALVCDSTPRAYTLSASPAASFTLTPTGGLPAGTICTVTVSAAQVTDADAGDPPDNMLADVVFSFSVPPDAVNDARGATGNVPINTATTGFSVLSNDVGPSIAVTAFDATSVQGGTVSVNGAGVFTYTPPVGYEGVDSFTYTITNPAGSDTAAVNLTVSGMLWFIDNTATACTTIAGGCGRLGTPFSTLASFDTVNGGGTVNGGDVIDPEAGDHIFLYTGSGSYTGPLTLEASQRVIGQGATSSLAALTGLTFAADSIALPSTGGVKPSITSGGAGITLASNDQLHGLAFSSTAGAAVNGAANVGTFTMSDIVVINTAGAGITFSGGGTVTATGVNTLQTTTGTALTVSNTNIGVAGLSFRSVSASGAVSGIVLANTGATAGLTVTGSGASGQGGDGSGGVIQNTTGPGISLSNTRLLSLSNLTIQNTAASGIDGTQVVDFTFDNGTITGSGDTNGEGNIAFNGSGSLSDGNHLSGVVVITDSILNTAFDSGIHLESTSGTISELTVSNNAFTSSTDTATSKGDAIKVITRGNAATVASVTRATIANNQIANFPSGGGIQVNGGNANGTGPGGTLGTPGSGTNIITITGNAIAGASAGNRMGTSPILFAVSGGNASSRSQGNAAITNNGTGGAPVRDFIGTGIGVGNNGNATSTVTVSNNVLVANNSLASQGIGGGNGVVLGCAAGTCETPDLTLVVTNNTISQTDGNGILLVGRGNLGLAKLGIRNNTVAAPLTGVRPGIRVDAGNASAGSDDAVCLDMSGNTTAGSGGHEGIGLRKQGTVSTTHDFGVEGMAATSTPGVEQFVGNTGQNPGSANGSFGTSGVLLLSGTSGFSACSSAP